MKNQQTLEVLRLKITHKDPLSVSDFGTSLVALDRLYREYINENDVNRKIKNTSLYISQVREGCMEIDFVALFEVASQGVSPENIPFVRNFITKLQWNIRNRKQITKETWENIGKFLQILKPGVAMEFFKLLNGKNEGSVFEISSDNIDSFN
jgi:hypothetical protein